MHFLSFKGKFVSGDKMLNLLLYTRHFWLRTD